MKREEKNFISLQRILDTATQEFARQGYGLSSVNTICNSGGISKGILYHYFKDKDDVVAACAEEAAIRLEEKLICSALKDIEDPSLLLKKLYAGCDEMASTMKFFASVCALSRYSASVAPVLGRLSARYEYYAKIFAENLGCELDEVRPYLFMAITTLSDYMIFGGKSYIEPQLRVFEDKLNELLINRKKQEKGKM